MRLLLALTIWLSAALFPKTGRAQNAEVIDWKLLSKVEFKDQYFQSLEAWYLVPEFSKTVQEYDGTTVIIKGYVIPMDVDGGKYALSAYPFSACFFCGGAGPESVMTLDFAQSPRRYETDEVVHFTGTLELNKTNFDKFNYVLKNARPVENPQ